MRKDVFGVSDYSRWVTKQTIKLQKMARDLKSWIYEVDGFYCLCCEIKD